ncbi:tetratricopeptide repeat protein [Calidithermus timidus]|jgi:tetratricopeptide (TPR) repeat protein|uniref:tetratricopeptide repeat protein n=1 Tax=Calidithermus timidus TaxID=307124 RepID=UPI00037E1463|nr:tetratricopeptide repeat protein [Calidithermus timidus]
MKAPLSDLEATLRQLVHTGRMDLAIRVLAEAFAQARSLEAQRRVLSTLFPSIPGDCFRTDAQAAELYAHALCRVREPEELLAFCQEAGVATPMMRLYRAWALSRLDRVKEALEEIEALDEAVLSDKGLYWRSRAELWAKLGLPGWEEAYARAREHLQHEALGRCLIDEGSYLYAAGRVPAARARWSEALAYLQSDPYYLAWAHYNLGISALSAPAEAERHLLEAERLSRKPAARPIRARALCGLGAARRILGEWPRALACYREALRVAEEADDRQQALWGLGHTSRLCGRVAEALGYFQQALALGVSSSGWLYADIAAAHLLLGDEEGAREAAERATHLKERGRFLLAVVRAELERRRGNPVRLGGFKLPNLWSREEALCFPELFALLAPSGPALEPKTQARVEVWAAGLLRVKVNGRPIPLRPTGRPAELLALLLEGEGEQSMDALLNALYPDAPATPEGRRKAYKSLWENVSKLRRALGWPQSIRSEGGSLRLDPDAHWVYDMDDPAARARKVFLEGIYSNWVQERRQELEGPFSPQEAF